MKKVLSYAVFSLLLVIAQVALFSIDSNALQFDDFTYEVNDSEVTITNCFKTGDSLTIPETIDGYTVKHLGSCAFYNKPYKHITMPDTIETIDDSCFCKCSYLQDINLSTSLKQLKSSAFYECRNLSSITIPKDIKIINTSCFSNCYSLKTVVMDDGVEVIGQYAFFCCYGLNSIEIPNSVEKIGQSAFERCKNLEKVSLSDNVKEICLGAFMETNLKEFTFPKSMDTIEDYLFCDCKNLKEINIPSNIKHIKSYAFINNPLEKVTISEGVLDIGDSAFKNIKIKNVRLPSTLKSIGNNAFDSCNELKNICIDCDSNVIDKDKHIFDNIHPEAVAFFTGNEIVEDLGIKSENVKFNICEYNKNLTNKNVVVSATGSDFLVYNEKVHTFTQNGAFTFVATYGDGTFKITETVEINNINKTPPVITIKPYNTSMTDKVTIYATTNNGTLNATSHTFNKNGVFTFIAVDALGNKSEKTIKISNIVNTMNHYTNTTSKPNYIDNESTYVKMIKNAGENEMVFIDLKDKKNKVIEGCVFEALSQHPNKVIKIDLGGVFITFKGKDINKNIIKDFYDFSFENDSKYKDVMLSKAENRDESFVYSFKFSGQLPGTACFEIDTNLRSKKIVDVFIYNPNDDSYTCITRNHAFVNREGKISYISNMCGDCIVTSWLKLDEQKQQNSKETATVKTQSKKDKDSIIIILIIILVSVIIIAVILYSTKNKTRYSPRKYRR